MSLSGLLIHTAGSHEVTTSDLASLPAPQSLGRWHRPVPHSEVLSELMQGITRHGWTPGAIRLGTSAKGQRLFGTIDLQSGDGVIGLSEMLRLTRSRIERLENRVSHRESPAPGHGWGPDMEATLGFRSSTDQSLALTAVAGAHVFVCDNLCTRATKRLTAQSKFEAENRVGRHFLSRVFD
jgi:hypothetical protein